MHRRQQTAAASTRQGRNRRLRRGLRRCLPAACPGDTQRRPQCTARPPRRPLTPSWCPRGTLRRQRQRPRPRLRSTCPAGNRCRRRQRRRCRRPRARARRLPRPPLQRCPLRTRRTASGRSRPPQRSPSPRGRAGTTPGFDPRWHCTNPPGTRCSSRAMCRPGSCRKIQAGTARIAARRARSKTSPARTRRSSCSPRWRYRRRARTTRRLPPPKPRPPPCHSVLWGTASCKSSGAQRHCTTLARTARTRRHLRRPRSPRPSPGGTAGTPQRPRARQRCQRGTASIPWRRQQPKNSPRRSWRTPARR